MDFIKGYKAVPYSDLQKELSKRYEESSMSLPDIAVSVEVQSTQTIKFAIESDVQKVSDKVLTSVCESLGFNAFVIWIKGEKYYFIKSKH